MEKGKIDTDTCSSSPLFCHISNVVSGIVSGVFSGVALLRLWCRLASNHLFSKTDRSEGRERWKCFILKAIEVSLIIVILCVSVDRRKENIWIVVSLKMCILCLVEREKAFVIKKIKEWVGVDRIVPLSSKWWWTTSGLEGCLWAFRLCLNWWYWIEWSGVINN
jgi:hypothetical protein